MEQLGGRKEVELKGLRLRGMCTGRRCSKQPKSSLLSSLLLFLLISPPPSSPPHSLPLPPSGPPASTSIHLPSHQKMPGTLPRFPTVPAMLGSLPRGIHPPSLPRGLTMPSLPGLPSMPRCVSLPRPAVMSTVSEAPRRLLQDCCTVLDHQSAAGNCRGGSRSLQPFPLFQSELLSESLF